LGIWALSEIQVNQNALVPVPEELRAALEVGSFSDRFEIEETPG
jgi:hypothetical protein